MSRENNGYKRELRPSHICRTCTKQFNCPNSTWGVKEKCDDYKSRF